MTTLHEVRPEDLIIGQNYIMTYPASINPLWVVIKKINGVIRWENIPLTGSPAKSGEIGYRFFGPISLASQTDGEDGDG